MAVRSGTLTKVGEWTRALNSRYFTLFADRLVYFTDEASGSKPNAKPRGEALLAGATLQNAQPPRQSATGKFFFSITFVDAGKSTSWILAADSQEDMRAWVEAIASSEGVAAAAFDEAKASSSALAAADAAAGWRIFETPSFSEAKSVCVKPWAYPTAFSMAPFAFES